ncbi:acyltransferase [Achromobacter sp. GG226]|uniref:acyltransferase family protein n=1 Tax=Verticiella alkaliphila TaxID=2779529 RepID=UPI001C0D4ED6|nr:acyltransferase family protein [Verticiella sp. GG226]MBU4611216.1 acyltransferase [Verticiella sp. GG226]
MDSQRSPIAYFPYIDGLRAIAVLAVFVYHLNGAWLPGGFAGVDIFFVISGFIVSASVGARRDMGLPSFLASFYARRLRRIGPALLVCLLTTALASAILIPAVWLSHTAPLTGLYAFFGLSNFILARTQNDYFSPISEFNPYTHTWSLGVEEQFYLVFPLLFIAWIGRHRRPRLSMGLFALAVILSLGWAAWPGQIDRTSAYYMITSRFWQLGAGVLLYQAMAMAGRRFDVATPAPWRWGGAVASAGLVALAVALATSRAQTFPFPGGLLVVAGALAVLAGLHGTPSGHWLVRALTNRPMLFAGRISYSLYLWHWPVFVLFRWTVGLDMPVMRFAAASLSLLLAAASYRWVETPMRTLAMTRRVPQIAIVIVGVGMLIGGAGLASLIQNKQSSLSITALARAPHDWYPYGSHASQAQPGCEVHAEIHLLSLDRRVDFRAHGCREDAQAPRRILAIGDSHAMSYEALFRRYVLDTGAEVSVYINGGCPFLSLQPWREDSAHCQGHARVAIEDMLATARPGDVIFLPSLRLPRLTDQWMNFPLAGFERDLLSPAFAERRDAAAREAVEVVRALRQTGALVVFEAPKPIFRSPPMRCVHAYNATNAICADGLSIDRDQLLKWREPVMAAMASVTDGVPGAAIWDPFPVLCPEGPECHAMRDGRPLFLDGDHISGYGNELVVDAFKGFLKGLANPGKPAPSL